MFAVCLFSRPILVFSSHNILTQNIFQYIYLTIQSRYDLKSDKITTEIIIKKDSVVFDIDLLS